MRHKSLGKCRVRIHSASLHQSVNLIRCKLLRTAAQLIARQVVGTGGVFHLPFPLQRQLWFITMHLSSRVTNQPFDSHWNFTFDPNQQILHWLRCNWDIIKMFSFDRRRWKIAEKDKLTRAHQLVRMQVFMYTSVKIANCHDNCARIITRSGGCGKF